ncbi:MAG: glycosyltransferase family 2 protein [Methylococcaceae bacterium]
MINCEYDVSVIIPTKNRLWALPKTIDSCRKNKCKVQIIVADDNSDDGTREWLQDQSDILYIECGGWGKPFAVNKAFIYAKARYIRYLDSDDWLPEKVIDIHLKIAYREEADIVVAGYDIYNDEKFIRYSPWEKCEDFIAQQLGECDSSHYSAFLFRRELVADIPHRSWFVGSDFANRDDRGLMIEVALRKPKVVIAEGSGLCHRHHKKNRLQFSNGLRESGTNLQHVLIYRQAAKQLLDRGELTLRRRQAIANSMWPVAHWVSRKYLQEGVDIANWVKELVPNYKQPERGLLAFSYRMLGFKFTEQLLLIRRMIVSVRRKPTHNSLSLPKIVFTNNK